MKNLTYSYMEVRGDKNYQNKAYIINEWSLTSAAESPSSSLHASTNITMESRYIILLLGKLCSKVFVLGRYSDLDGLSYELSDYHVIHRLCT